MTYLPALHMGKTAHYTNAWPDEYVSPRTRALVDEIDGLIGERDYKVCSRCVHFISAKGKFDAPIEAGAIPNWFTEEWGFCKLPDWDDIEMVRKTDTCDEWEER